MKSLQLFWTQYADFSRRSDRKEFWISQAWHLLFTSPFWIYQLVLLFSNSKSEEEVIPLTGMDVSAWFSIFFLLYLYLIFVPQQAVVVRRLRDAGLHWSLIFLFLGPILLYLLSPISIFLVLALAGLLCLACTTGPECFSRICFDESRGLFAKYAIPFDGSQQFFSYSPDCFGSTNSTRESSA